MGYFKAVRSGGEISMRIADLLETAAPKEYTGANRVKTILECNDVLQGRADNISIGMLEEFLEQKCGVCYPERVAELKQEMEDFFHQKMLRTWRYTTTGKQTYDYEMYDFEPERPLKIINQQIFDDAAERGFTPDFFTKSYFDKVIIYCITHIVLTEFGKTLIFHSAPGQIWIAAVDGLMMANILILPYRRGKSCMLVGTNISEHRIGGVLRAPQ